MTILGSQEIAPNGDLAPPVPDPTRDVRAGGGAYYKLSPVFRYVKATFAQQAITGPLRYVVRDYVATSSWGIDMLGDLGWLLESCDVQLGDRGSWILRHDDDLFTLVELNDGWAAIETLGADPSRAQATCEQVAAQIRGQEQDTSVTPITFWARDPEKYPQRIHRSIETPSWDDLAENYGVQTRERMARLLELEDCPAERMILWHGAPGSGKTHALRALARAWQDWCDVAFITDPEWFFGGSPTYLFDVARDAAGKPAAEAAKRSKLIVLEDAGEMMSAGARHEAGQNLSRLLNLTDGLLGQGLKVMVLITTNEPLSALHPAVIRPGRCLAEIEFGSFTPHDANQWLERHGSDAIVDGPATLADLYAILGGHDPRRLANANGHRVTA